MIAGKCIASVILLESIDIIEALLLDAGDQMREIRLSSTKRTCMSIRT